ncbi:MAG: hypothetical protein IT364_13675 [Candidatus Hydrogenedentes bacterium]|nr:hypothetical protein [Candidatus Hydrogenedentota bacterium]
MKASKLAVFSWVLGFVCSAAQAAELAGPLSEIVSGPPRQWTVGETNGSVHCMGNGRLCVYGQGPDLIQIFGPTYSTTTSGRVSLELPGATSESRRVPGAAIWEHRILADGRLIAVLTDFVQSELDCFVRQVDCAEPVDFVFHPEAGLRRADNAMLMRDAGAELAFLLETPIGKPSVPFGNYPIPFAFFNALACFGDVEVARGQENGATRFRFGPGKGTLYVSGGPELEACLKTLETAVSLDCTAMLARTQEWWADFTAQGRDFAAELPADAPMRDRLVQVLDDVAVMIKAQQAVEGGVLAGYPYHLGYVRDQYGTHRGLVALGHEEMSRDILLFYFNVFRAHGQIHNAQAFGMPGLFHIHENDDVEITGYITLQAFDYLARSGDTEFLTRIFPMLEWAWEVQQRQLVLDMLPFNGDETYVAGGILPRTALNDGSAEATMLFIDGGVRVIDFAAEHGLWNAERIQKSRELLDRVRGSFRGNFWRDERLITNNPTRAEQPGAQPRVRHGVCEACVTVQWTQRTDQGRYVCIDCLNRAPLPKAETKVYTLQSVSLTPLYFHSSLFTQEELQPQVQSIVDAYNTTGGLPSRPDSDVSVGYDYGLLLYALTELDHPMAREFYVKTLQLADDTGAWAEYYQNHVPSGTRCRPWESAINIEALLHWVAKEYGTR